MILEIDVNALGRDIDSLRSLSANLENALNSLTESMQSLNQTWEGTAKNVYLGQYQIYELQMQQLCKTINEFIKTLVYAKEQYQICDNNVKSAVSQIQI